MIKNGQEFKIEDCSIDELDELSEGFFSGFMRRARLPEDRTIYSKASLKRRRKRIEATLKTPFKNHLYEFWQESQTKHFSEDFLNRRLLIPYFSFSVPSAAVIEVLSQLSPIYEAAAGTGYWARLISEAGGTVYAYDQAPVDGPLIDRVKDDTYPDIVRANNYFNPWSWYPVKPFSALTTAELAAQSGDTFMLSWPSYDKPWGGECIKAYFKAGGHTLIYIGEDWGGCCGDNAMFHYLNKLGDPEVHALPQWEGIHDSLYIYREKGCSLRAKTSSNTVEVL